MAFNPLKINPRTGMTNETTRAQERANDKSARKRDLQAAISNRVRFGYPDFVDAYTTKFGKSFHKMTPTELNTMLYALAWCQAWSKSVNDWFTAGFTS